MRDWLTGNQSLHLPELRECGIVVTLFLEFDAQIKPCVRQLWVAHLNTLQLSNPGGCVSGTQQSEAQIQLLADGPGRHQQCQTKFTNGLLLGSRVLIERLTEIPVLCQTLCVAPRRTDGKGHSECYESSLIAPAWHPGYEYTRLAAKTKIDSVQQIREYRTVFLWHEP